jgi:DNA gyrase subunit A
VSPRSSNTIRLAIEDELKESYLNYAMSVIVSRALPDVRDGLKPVHRRILFAMNELGLRSDRNFMKTGRIVGDVLGKYHPHGDQSIYDALVRLAQDFSLRYPVIDGQGNFGSLDGDPPAAMRYTEARLQSIAEELLRNIDNETVDFSPNYDDSMKEPKILPSALPNLLLNGGSGIAVGMATNLPPHNLNEVAKGIVALIENPKTTTAKLMSYIPAPDFPTGGNIFGRSGIVEAYETGRGKIVVRAKVTLETKKNGRNTIIINELPYLVNKSNLVKRIAELTKEGKLDGIMDLRDESDRGEPVRIVIELKRNAIPNVVLNQLFNHTQLQNNFNVINLALVNGRPRLLSLKEMLQHFIEHRKEVVTRRSQYELRKAEERAHILKGLKIALDNIDEVVELIKGSSQGEEAKKKLMKRFRLTEKQAQAVLDMRLQRLTSLEIKKVVDELAELQRRIAQLKALLADERKILNVVKVETEEIAQKFGDERRTDLYSEEIEEFNIEDLIVKENMVILISHQGFINRVPISAYRRQQRGGRGSSSVRIRGEDFMEHLFVASTHDYLFFVTNEGKGYWLKVHQIPVGSRASRGQPLKSLLSLSDEEILATVLPIKEFSDDSCILMATSRGVIKKVKTSGFVNAKTRGIAAIKLDPGDSLVSAKMASGDDEVILITRRGNALRFHEKSVRSTGRASRGVTGIRLSDDDRLAGVVTIGESDEMLLVSEYGFGKRILCSLFTPHGRGTRGQKCYRSIEKTGELVGALSVKKADDIVCISSLGNLLKIRTRGIPIQGKTASGVRIVNLEKPDSVVGVARVAKEDSQ